MMTCLASVLVLLTALGDPQTYGAGLTPFFPGRGTVNRGRRLFSSAGTGSNTRDTGHMQGTDRMGHRLNQLRILFAALLCGVVTALGCASTGGRANTSGGSAARGQVRVAPDFMLEFAVYRVDGGRASVWRREVYVVEPDRSFRSAVGRNAAVHSYPPARDELSPREMEALFKLVETEGLIDRDSGTTALANDASPLSADWVYNVRLLAFGRVVRFETTSLDTAVKRLHEHLRKLAGFTAVTDEQPAGDADAASRPASEPGDGEGDSSVPYIPSPLD